MPVRSKDIKVSNKGTAIAKSRTKAQLTGRPKGSFDLMTLKRMELKIKLAEDVQKAYKWLTTSMEAGEGWAHSIFWRDLAPRRIHKDTTIIASQVPNSQKLDTYLEGLEQFQELTLDELLSIINALGSVKLSKKIEESLLNTEKEKESGVLEKISYIFSKRHENIN